jgi:hypothetical protein
MMSKSFSIPTFRTEASKSTVKEMCIENMSSQDLEKLKKTDPFMYYSIPQVRKAAVLNKGVVSSLASEGEQKVTRASRLSFECHGDLMLDEYFQEMNVGRNRSQERDASFVSSREEDDLYLSFFTAVMTSSRKRKDRPALVED